MAKKRRYVNNPDFHAALVEYLSECDKLEEEGKELPVIPKYITDCIWQISTNTAKRDNFSGYSYKEDMIMDGVENCLKYIRKYKYKEFTNPFAYFTRCVWNAFLVRIAAEKKELYIRYKTSKQLLAMGETHIGDMPTNLTSDAEYINQYIYEYEKKNSLGEFKKKRKKSK